MGRIAAVDDPHWNDFYKSRTGFFGMFESIDDPTVARGLFDAAASWVKAQGFPEMMGPFNFSTNYECAVLVEGFEAPPAIMMAYNPRYYDALYTGAGFTKAKDLWAYDLSSSVPPPVLDAPGGGFHPVLRRVSPCVTPSGRWLRPAARWRK